MSAKELNITVEGDRAYLGPGGIFIPSDSVKASHEVHIFRYILVSLISVFAWEWLVTVHEEIARWRQFIKHRKLIRVNVAVVASRYLSIANALAGAFFFFGNPSSCQAVFTLIFLTWFLIWFCTAVIFVTRVHALCAANVFAKHCVTALLVVCSCLWIVSLGGFYAARLPDELRTPDGPYCSVAPAPRWHVMAFAAMAFFDFVILVVTLQRVMTIMNSPQPVGTQRSTRSWLIETALVYAGVCLCVNVATLCIWVVESDVIRQAYPIPFAILVNPIVASRIVFHGDLWGAKSALLQSKAIPEEALIFRGNPGAAKRTDRPRGSLSHNGGIELANGVTARNGSISISGRQAGIAFSNPFAEIASLNAVAPPRSRQGSESGHTPSSSRPLRSHSFDGMMEHRRLFYNPLSPTSDSIGHCPPAPPSAGVRQTFAIRRPSPPTFVPQHQFQRRNASQEVVMISRETVSHVD